MSISNFAIVVVTFNRAESLERLLKSLGDSIYDSNFSYTLIISIDGGGSSDVLHIAESFKWKFGKKEIIQRTQNIGLRAHILKCGELTIEYGAVLILEDDLYVSQYFPYITKKLVNYYGNSDELAGASLYSYKYNEYAKMPFFPLTSQYDIYLMQVASSWGQIWTKKQWLRFKAWYDDNVDIGVNLTDPLPEAVINWPNSSWKKFFQKYMVEKGLYIVYPYEAYVTNFADVGSHFAVPMQHFQIPLCNIDKDFNFCDLDEAEVFYDAYYEPLPSLWENGFSDVYKGKVELDLFGLKLNRPIQAEYLISIHDCKNPILSYSSSLIPPVNNVLFNVIGNDYSLSKKHEFIVKSKVSMMFHKFSRVITPSIDDLFFYCLSYIKLRVNIFVNKKIRSLKPKL